MVTVDADEVLAMIQKEFPKEYLLCVQKVALLKQQEELNILRARLSNESASS